MRILQVGLPPRLRRLARVSVGRLVRTGGRGIGRIASLVDDVPISVKAFAASCILVLWLIGLGANGYLALDRAATGLSHHSNVELPKQRAASELATAIVATHLKVFRIVTWAQVGVAADSQDAARGELLTRLDALGGRLRLLGEEARPSPDEAARLAALSAKWDKYVREIADVLAAAASDAPMASMLLSATDDEFRSIASELQGVAALAADRTRATSRELAAEVQRSRNVLALGGALGVLICALVALFIGRSVVAPIRAITQAMRGLTSGHGRIAITSRNRKDEIGQMVEAIAQFRETMERQNRLLQDRQDELSSQNMRFDAALNHMAQGLAMFDAGQRLVVCNRRYAELYDLTPDEVRPGTTIRQLLEHRHRRGLFGDVNFEKFAEEWLAEFSHASSRVQELADGRVLSIMRRPMLDGGIVSTTEDITEQRRSEARIAHMALHDALTGLPNRVLLSERLDHALARAKRGALVATHLLDLDRFKNVNDTLGHGAGDKLLRSVAERLRALVRESDTVARIGGDEFAVMQVAISQISDATSLAQRIIDTLSRPYDIEGQQAVIGTSVGISVGPVDGECPEQILRNADLALYRAKSDGRGTYRFFERDMDAQMQARRALECDLRKALARGEFELYYQPVVDLASNRMSSVEALIRWRHPEKGMVPPGTFIALAEEIGLIVPIGEWAIREACAAAARWPQELRIAVNLSPAQFRNPGLLQTIVAALATSGLSPNRLELEITETILLQDSEATLATLYRLRELGVRVAMDDFGTGYSSLSYLQSFPFDKIKIDRSFVRDIAESAGSLNIVRAVAALAKGLGMAATAEGVETQEQLDRIRSEGCSEMQGFLFSEPLPAAEFERQFLAQIQGAGAAAGVAA